MRPHCLLLWLALQTAVVGAQSDPQAAAAEAQRGVEAAHDNDFDGAVAAYQRALALDPELPGLYLNLGLARFKSGHFQEAIAAFEQARRRTPGSQVETLMAMSYFGLRQYKEAAQRLKPLSEASPQNGEIAYLLAKSDLWSGDYEGAMQVFHKLLEQDANAPAVHMLLGEALDAHGRTPEAISEFEQAARLQPKQPDVHFGLGYLYWKGKKYGDARREFESEIANDPQHALALTFLADSDLHEGHEDLALPLLTKAIAIRPNIATAYVDLGSIYMSQKRLPQAVEALRTAVSIDGSSYDAHYRLARVYRQLGRNGEADAEFAIVRTLQEQRSAEPLLKLSGPR